MRGPLFHFVCLLAAAALTSEAKTVQLDQTPSVVQKTIQAQVGDGKLAAIEESDESGESAFEVTFTSKAGVERDFTVATDGTLLSVEVGLSEAPDAVQKTIHEQAAGWELKSIDKNLGDAESSFDVEVKKDGREKTFTVEEDGTLSSMSVTLTETPAAVQAAIKAELADGSVDSIDKNFDEEGDSYDVEGVAKGGGRKSFSVAPDGRLLSREVTLAETPPAAQKTIRERIGEGKILRIDQSLAEKKGGVLPFEVRGRKGGKPFDFSVGPKGKFLGMDD